MTMNFLSFAPVFLKELRQIWHSKLLFILLFLSIACDIICFFLSFLPVASFLVNSISTLIRGIVFISSMISSLAILTSAINRWQLERGDPAIDIALTSPIAPWRIALEKTLAIAFSNFLMVLVIFPVTCLSLWKENSSESVNEVVSLLPVSLLTLLGVIPIVLSSCSSISSKSRVKRNGMSGIVLLVTYFAFTGLLSFFRSLGVENYIFIYCCIALGVSILGLSLMISQLSPIKSDRNLFIHFSLLLLPLVISLLVVVFNNNLQLKNIVPYVMGIVSSIFIFASLVERKNPSIRQIENCKRNPYLLIASVIFSSGAFQCLVLSLISFIMAFTFGNWILLEYSLLLKIIVYFAIYSFIANVVYLFYQKFFINICESVEARYEY